MPSLQLRTLGRFELVSPEGEVVLGRGKPLAVLGALAAHPRRSLSRDRLVDLMWGDQGEDRGRASLRQALVVLRRCLGAAAIVADNDQVELAGELVCDRTLFLGALRRGDTAEACERYVGDFIPNCAFPGGARFEEWVELERRQLRRLFLEAAHAFVRSRMSSGDVGAAGALASRVRDADPSLEEGWRLLLECLALMGDEVRLRLEVESMRTMLEADERLPDPATRRWLERTAVVRPVDADAIDQQGEFSECVGRDAEFSVLLAAWERARGSGRAQFVRISAASGFGKSRLLSEFRRRLRASGGRVVNTGARIDERDLPGGFAADVAGLVGALPGAAGVSSASASLLVGLSSTLQSQWRVAAEVPESGDERLRRRAIALADLLTAVATERPLVLMCDDVQWVDDLSCQLLVGAFARVEGGLLVVAADRGERSIVPSGAEPLHLPALRDNDVIALLESDGDLDVGSEAIALFVGSLVSSSGGSPLLILQTLRTLRATGALALVDGRWTLSDPEGVSNLLERERGLVTRVAALPSALRERLARLSLLRGPVLAEWLPADWARVLEELERLGLAQRAEGRWSVVHEAIVEAAVAVCTADELRLHTAAAATIAESFPPEERWLVRIGRLWSATGDVARAGAVFRTFVERRRSVGDDRAPRELAVKFLGSDSDVAAVRTLVRFAPRRPARLFWLIAAAAVGLVTVLAEPATSMLRPRLVLSRQAVVASEEFEVSPVVELQSSGGTRLRDSEQTVSVRFEPDSGRLLGERRVRLEDGVAEFGALRLVGLGNGVLRFTLPGARDVVSDSIFVDGKQTTLRVARWTLNGRESGADVTVLELRPGEDSIVGTLRLEYRALNPSAAVLLVAAPSWRDGPAGCFTLTAVVNRVRSAQRPIEIRLPAPASVGEHSVVLGLAPETQGEFICSQTNWQLGTPVWGDGADLNALSPAARERAVREGSITVPWRYSGRNGAGFRVDTTTIGAAVIRVVRR